MKLSTFAASSAIATALLGGCDAKPGLDMPNMPAVPQTISERSVGNDQARCRATSCTLQFNGTGAVRLPAMMGSRRVELTRAATKSATVRVAGRSVRLSANRPVRVGLVRLRLLPPHAGRTRIRATPALPLAGF